MPIVKHSNLGEVNSGSLRRQTIRHSAVYSVATVLGRMAGFIMLPFYARIFETEGYGIIGMIDSSLGLLAIAFTTGVHDSILRIYHEEPEERKSQVIGTAILTVWALSLMCVPLPALASPWISGFLLGDSTYWPLFGIAMVTFVVDMGGRSAGAFLIIRQQSMLYSFVNLLQLVMGITFNIILVIHLRIGLIGIFITSLICASVGSIIFHWAAIRNHGLHYDSAIRRKLLKFWFPLIPGELAAYIARQAERYIIRFFIGLKAVGILEMAYKFPPLLNLFVVIPFMRAWRTKSMEIGELPNAPREISSMFTLYMFLTLFVAVFLAGNIPVVLEIMTPAEFWPAARIAQIDVATTVLGAANTYLIFGLLYGKRTKTIARLRSVTAAVKVALSIIFIALAGLKGAAYSALLMEAVFLIWSFNRAQRVYWLPIEYRKISVLGISAVCLVMLIGQLPQVASGLIAQVKMLIFDRFITLLSLTPVAQYQQGKLIRLLDARAIEFAKLFLGCFICLFYGTLILIVKADLVSTGYRHIHALRLTLQNMLLRKTG